MTQGAPLLPRTLNGGVNRTPRSRGGSAERPVIADPIPFPLGGAPPRAEVPGHAARAGRESEHLWGRVGAWHQKHDVLHEVPKQHVVHVKMRPSRVIVVVPQSAHARVATARSNAAVKTVRSMAGSPSESVSVRQSAPDLPRNTRSQDICTRNQRLVSEMTYLCKSLHTPRWVGR